MTSQKQRTAWFGVGLLWAAVSGAPALADDTELFIATSTAAGAKPNIMLILDNSGSMAEDVRTQGTYDGNITYPAGSSGCDSNKVYYRVGAGGVPSCTTNRWFNLSALHCKAAKDAFVTVGIFTDYIAMYDTTDNNSNGKRWEAMNNSKRDAAVECEDDAGIHGANGSSSGDKWARNGSTSNGRWGTEAQRITTWGASPQDTQQVTLWSGNYMNYTYGPTFNRPKIDVMKEVANNLLDSVNGVNVGLMTFNDSLGTSIGSQGGHVVQPIKDIATSRAALKSSISALGTDAFTPLSETMYEAALYMSGRTWDYGNPTSIATSRLASPTSQYKTPIDFACQKNYIVYLTDGEPTRDVDADTKIRSMTDRAGTTFSSLVGNTCDVETYDSSLNPSGGECLDELAEFLYEGDFSTLPGKQNVTTYTVGFDIDLQVLADTAARGGGDYYTASDTASLAASLQQIVTSILASNTTFTAPTVAVNAFNRTQNLSDLFISVFRPSSKTHWPGNLKKFTLNATTSEIIDRNKAAAIDPLTGTFKETAVDYWSTTTGDGQDVEAGGAANLIPLPDARLVYTNLGASDKLYDISNRVDKTNILIDDAMLQTGASGEPTRDEVIDFINGWDVSDVDQDVNTKVRRQLGDPLHSQPVSMVYGPGLREGIVFSATNDGVLHAIDMEDGRERWAFVPKEFLDDQTLLLKDDAMSTKHYGIDGDLALQVVANGDEVIDGDEKVYLFFGLRRGGEAYYALDVSVPSEPRLMWRLDGTTLTGLGQTWSTPVPTRISVTGAGQSDSKLVVVLGGGYEPDQDLANASTDTAGNSIYIVDSEKGTMLWHGGLTAGNKLFNTANRSMSYSIPSDVRVIDLDGNGLADRMYAADMGGQIWRFDITNNSSAADLVSGGVIAQLGAAPAATPAAADVRRFYYAPDIALINTRGYDYLHIGIGSGSRGNPLGTAVQDRFYALRDYNFGKLTQTQYNALTLITNATLTPITAVNTSVPQTTSPGWYIPLSTGGEKVLAEARTFNNEVIFTSFKPGSSGTSCVPQAGTNRVYRVNVVNASPVLNLDGAGDPATLTMADMYAQSEGAPLPSPQLIFLDGDLDGDGTPDAEDDTDNDGIADNVDDDFDGDGVIDSEKDTDGDGTPDHSDDDIDGDGIPNGTDTDANGNNVPDANEPNRGVGKVVAVIGLMRFPVGYRNDPVRTYWRQGNVGN